MGIIKIKHNIVTTFAAWTDLKPPPAHPNFPWASEPQSLDYTVVAGRTIDFVVAAAVVADGGAAVAASSSCVVVVVD